jgi:L-serine dehydratase
MFRNAAINSMPSAFRETAQGGLAATPTGGGHEARIFGMLLNKRE